MTKSDIVTVGPGKAALMLQVSARTVARWADDPDHPLTVHSITEGGQRRFLRSDVEALAAERQTAA